jgi:putative hemolysin
MAIIPTIIALALLLACSGFLSGSETSLFSLSSVRVRRLQSESKVGRLIAALLAHPRSLLSTILICNILVNVFASSLSASLFRMLGARGLVPESTASVLSVAVMTCLILIFGEITPKTIAIRNSEPLARAVAPVIYTLAKIVAPLRAGLLRVTGGIVRLVDKRIPADGSISRDELRTAVRIGLSEGVLDSQERDMIHGVFVLESRQVRDIMKPRRDLFALDLATPPETLVRRVREHEYARVPVYDEDPDQIIGMLYARDLLACAGGQGGAIDVRALLREPYFVPEAMAIDDLLAELRRRAVHFALAVDEYGTVSGFLTLEDVLEVIVGRIDFKKGEAVRYSLEDDRTVLADAALALDELNAHLGTSLTDEFSVSIGGLITHRLGRIPEPGERLELPGVRIEVLRAKKHRVELVRVQRTDRKGGPRR